MSLTFQILLGSGILGLCSAVDILVLILTVKALRRIGERFHRHSSETHWGSLMAVAFAAVVFAHTVQVWIWAVSFVLLGALPNFSDAIYFSIVTYTTLGYGDVTVAYDYRMFAAMAAMTGLLNFGLSTAFLVGLLTRLLSWNKD